MAEIEEDYIEFSGSFTAEGWGIPVSDVWLVGSDNSDDTLIVHGIYLTFGSESGTDRVEIYYWGGDGYDTLDYADGRIDEGISATWYDGGFGGDAGFRVYGGNYHDSSIDRVTTYAYDIEEISGTKYGDSISASGADWGMVLDGEGGDDTLTGSGHDDELIGGDGSDTLYGNGGNDALYAGDGSDALYGGSGDDVLYLEAEPGTDITTADGGTGSDVFVIAYDTSPTEVEGSADSWDSWAENKGVTAGVSTAWSLAKEFAGVSGPFGILASSAVDFGISSLYMALAGSNDATAGSLTSSVDGYVDIQDFDPWSDMIVIPVDTDYSTAYTLSDAYNISGATLELSLASNTFGYIGLDDDELFSDSVSESSKGAILTSVYKNSLYIYKDDSGNVSAKYVNGYDLSSDLSSAQLEELGSYVDNGSGAWLLGNYGPSVVFGGTSDSYVIGNDHTNIMYAGDFTDLDNDGYNDYFDRTAQAYMYAGDGDDFVYGAQGDDQLFGQEGDDWLLGHTGDDKIYGGDGSDTASYMTVDESSSLGIMVDLGDVQNDNSGGDDYVIAYRHDGSSSYKQSNYTVAEDELYSVENIQGSDYNDYLVGNDSDNVLGGGGGDNNTLIGGGGNDTFISGEGSSEIYGGSGTDTVDYSSSTTSVSGTTINWDYITHSGGTDTFVNADGGVETVIGSDYDDDITGHWTGNTLYGEGGNDVLYAGGSNQNNTLYGGVGEDTLVGNGGSDTLYGGDDDDTLIGGDGDDTIAGGDGFDRFEFDGDDGTNIITDFGEGSYYHEDYHTLIGDTVAFEGDVEVTTETIGSDTYIYSGNTTVILDGFTGSVTASLFAYDSTTGMTEYNGDTVICTYMHEIGEIPSDIYQWDAYYGRTVLGVTVQRGYHAWAI
ncbi:hypothetical protein E1297_03415, partial [Roseibium sp. RKSG952]